MARQYATQDVNADGSFDVAIAFSDKDGDAITPTAASWSLLDMDGTVVNSRSLVEITPLDTAVIVHLSGADLAILNGAAKESRVFYLYWTYTSGATDYIVTDELQFNVVKMIGSPPVAE